MQIGSRFMEGSAFLFLGICAVFDIRKKEIPLITAVVGALIAFGVNLYQIKNGTISVVEVGFSLLPGVFLLLISFCTKEKIGYGDGLLLLVIGLFTGFYQCFLGLCLGLIISSVFGLWLLVFRKADKNSEIPFVPFLVIGMGVGFFV